MNISRVYVNVCAHILPIFLGAMFVEEIHHLVGDNLVFKLHSWNISRSYNPKLYLFNSQTACKLTSNAEFHILLLTLLFLMCPATPFLISITA